MKGPKRFIIAAAVGAAVFLLFRAFLVSPVRGEADRALDKIRNRLAERKSYFKENGEPIRKLKKELEAEARTLGELAGSVGPVGLALPPELEPTDDHIELSYYQMQRSRLNERAAGTGIAFSNAKSPLGLPLVVPEDRVPEFLARLAVAGRFLDAAASARLARVISAAHPARRIVDGRGPGGLGRLQTSASSVEPSSLSRRASHSRSDAPAQPSALKGSPATERVLEELPIKVVAAVDEEGLILLLQKLSRPERFLALNELKLEVKNPASGTFEATLELAGVRMIEAPKEAEAGPEVPGPPGRPPIRGFRKRW